jgi:hypothetical protein
MSDDVDTSLVRRSSYAVFRERGLMALAGMRMWRRRIISELAATDDESELDTLSIELKDCWDVMKMMVGALEKIRKIRGGEEPLFPGENGEAA